MTSSLAPAESIVPTKYWHRLDDGRIQCDLCPRFCKLRDGQRGLCYVRGRQEDQIVLTTYGRSSGFCIDPIEKKPLNHFLPGTPVISFGTAGCNLACRFCQNWSISKANEFDVLADQASPEQIADAAEAMGCRSVAFTYNDPVVFMEYAIEVADVCRDRGIAAVAVTAGYINPEPTRDFYTHIDATNIDLKGITEDFYKRMCAGHLQPVLDTLVSVRHRTDVWLEITTLIIPGRNDDPKEIDQLTRWIAHRLGRDVPLHFTAFHPDFRMMDVPPTPAATLHRARQIAQDNGLRYVYVGNIHDGEAQTTHCASCNAALIERIGYDIVGWSLDGERKCQVCSATLPGVFEPEPGRWGSRRQPVSLGVA